MKHYFKLVALTVTLMGLWLMDLAPEALPVPVFVGNAEAIVGRPVSPVSVAGVARRTTRRAVYATSASTATQQQQAQPAQQQQAQAAPAPAAALPAGTVVTALPAGCESVVIDGGNYFNCSGVIYQPTFQSNNLVYVVK